METCRENKTAKCPLISQNEMKDKPRGTTDYATYDGILIQKWKDNKDVILIFNFETTAMFSINVISAPQRNMLMYRN